MDAHTYRTTMILAGRAVTITCEMKRDRRGWHVLPPVAIDADGLDVTDKIDFKTDTIIRDGATTMLYDLYPGLRAYDPYFGMQSA